MKTKKFLLILNWVVFGFFLLSGWFIFGLYMTAFYDPDAPDYLFTLGEFWFSAAFIDFVVIVFLSLFAIELSQKHILRITVGAYIALGLLAVFKALQYLHS